MAPAVLKELWWFRSTIVMVATPLLLALMLPFYNEMGLTKEACNCLYMLLLMAVYWCTETLPLGVTSLIPLVLSPALSIQKAGDVAREYLKDLNVMFLGGLMVAVVIEHSQLHRRISLGILRKVGTNPRMLMLGFMIPTWFLSMWISNTATTAMMLAIVRAVIDQLNVDETELKNMETGDTASSVEQSGAVSNEAYETSKSDIANEDTSESEVPEATEEGQTASNIHSRWQATSKALSLCVCYAATCGGIATLTGTSPNIILGENINILGEQLQYDFGFDFVSWLGFGLPVSFIMVLITWLWLQLFFLGFRGDTQSDEDKQKITRVINKAYDDLGSIKFKEVVATIHFVLLAVLWITRNPGGVGGWGSLFPDKMVSDATAVMFIAILTFMWPSEIPDMCCLRGGCGHPAGHKAKHRKPLITWEAVAQKVPWGLILLLGGGFALAKAIEVSGLSKILGESLNFFDGWSTWTIVLCISTITAFITEITSNTAISTIFLPIVGSVAIQLKLSPLYLMLPVAASSSFAFMLPVATPPNALVFATGVLSIRDMASAGLLLNILGIGVVTLATMTWGSAVFKLEQFDYSTLNITDSFLNETANATITF